MNEIALGKRISLMASELGHRIFRCNVGEGWIGKSTFFSEQAKVEVYPGDVIIRKAKRLHFGLCTGQGDYIGFSNTGRFISLELKTETGKIRPEQTAFAEAVRRSGGIAGIVRDEEEAFELLS
jgi:hypothetical protein